MDNIITSVFPMNERKLSTSSEADMGQEKGSVTEDHVYEHTTDSKGRVETRLPPDHLKYLYKSPNRNNLPPFGVDLSVYDWLPAYNVFLASLPHYEPRTRITRRQKSSQPDSSSMKQQQEQGNGLKEGEREQSAKSMY